jgi:hypothetical protein
MAGVLRYTMNVLHRYRASDKVIGFCGNRNTSFGGAGGGGAARGGPNNVFAKLNTGNLKMNSQDTGSAASILHNALQTSPDILATDVEAILNKIFQYVHICMVRVQELEAFCDFVDAEYKQILGSVKTRRVSFQPAITSYFHVSPH